MFAYLREAFRTFVPTALVLAVAVGLDAQPPVLPAPPPAGPAEPPSATGATVSSSAPKPSPAFCVAVRTEYRQALRKKGVSFLDSWRKADAVTDEVIALALPDAMKITGQTTIVGKLGDGAILKKIVEFFNSPLGRALIEALINLLMNELTVAHPVPFPPVLPVLGLGAVGDPAFG